MPNVSKIMQVMHQFSPKGQEMVLQFLKENKTTLKKDFGFAEFPRIISDKKMTDNFEKELLDKNNSIRSIITGILKKTFQTNILKKINRDNQLEVLGKVEELAYQVDGNQKYNPRGKGAFLATKHFEKKKQDLLELLEKKCGKSARSLLDGITPENIDNYFVKENIITSAYIMANPFKSFQTLLRNKKAMKQAGQELCDLMLEAQKILLDPNKDKRVRKIENILKTKYDFKYVYLDNIEDAVSMLKAVKLAKENNIPLVENIIISPYIKANKAGFNIKQGNTIFINTNQGLRSVIGYANRLNCEKDLRDAIIASSMDGTINQTSTSNSMHVFLHEFIHRENPEQLLDITIPESFRETVSKLGSYAEDAFNKSNEEIRVELKVKQLLERLNPEEEELLNLLQSAIKKP